MTNGNSGQMLAPAVRIASTKYLSAYRTRQRNHVHTVNGHCANSSIVAPPMPASRGAATTTFAATAAAAATCAKRNLSTTATNRIDSHLEKSVNLFAEHQRQQLTIANIQKLAMEPTREHIENIRLLLRNINAKDNNNQLIRLNKDDETGIGLVCIKSAAKNGISAKMMCDFLDVIDQLYAWPEGKGVLIYGHDGFFCSGGDLVSVRELANYEDGLKMATLMQYNMARLQALPMITMALIQGKAIGGGAEVAVTTDLRAMASSSLVGYVHTRVGIMAAWGGGSRLVQLVGPSRAVELMTSGRLVAASEALSLGLVNEIIDDSGLNDEQVLERGKQYLKQHIMGAKSSIMAIKNLVNAARTLPLEQSLVVEGQLLSSTWGKPAHLEALDSHVKHRGD